MFSEGCGMRKADNTRRLCARCRADYQCCQSNKQGNNQFDLHCRFPLLNLMGKALQGLYSVNFGGKIYNCWKNAAIPGLFGQSCPAGTAFRQARKIFLSRSNTSHWTLFLSFYYFGKDVKIYRENLLETPNKSTEKPFPWSGLCGNREKG